MAWLRVVGCISGVAGLGEMKSPHLWGAVLLLECLLSWAALAGEIAGCLLREEPQKLMISLMKMSWSLAKGTLMLLQPLGFMGKK